MEVVVFLHGQRTVLELQAAIIYACAYPRGEPLANGKAIRGFQPPEQVFAAKRGAEKGRNGTCSVQYPSPWVVHPHGLAAYRTPQR